MEMENYRAHEVSQKGICWGKAEGMRHKSCCLKACKSSLQPANVIADSRDKRSLIQGNRPEQ